MAIVRGFDLHRRQITFDCMDTETGELKRGRIMPVDRLTLRGWLERFKGLEGDFAVEAGTGWRFVVEELTRAGLRAHLADPGEAASIPRCAWLTPWTSRSASSAGTWPGSPAAIPAVVAS